MALFSRLAAIPNSPPTLSVIAYPNRSSTEPDAARSVKWLRATLLPAPVSTLGIGDGSYNQIYGILQVDAIMYAGDGEPEVARLAQSVAQWFARGTTLTQDGQTVRIWKAPYRGRLMADLPWVFIPVSIPYIAFANAA